MYSGCYRVAAKSLHLSEKYLLNRQACFGYLLVHIVNGYRYFLDKPYKICPYYT